MEYLMTYGWALIVIVIVVAALFALGILNPAAYQQKRCSGFQYFTYVDQKLSASEYVLHVKNGAESIAITGIKVGTGAIDASPTLSNTSALQQGADFTIQTTNVPSGTTTGNSFSNMPVVVSYNVIDGITNNSDRGLCVGTVAA